MTRRDLQSAAKEKQRPWDIGKDVEQSAVLGDIAPAAEIGHPDHGRIELRVNGQTQSIVRPVAADSRRRRGDRAPVAVLPSAAGRSHLHRHPGRRRPGEARRSARRVDRRRWHDRAAAERARLSR